MNEFLIWAFWVGFFSPLIVMPWFFMLGMAHELGYDVSIRGLWALRHDMGYLVAVSAIVFGLVGWAFDVIFNVFWGTLLFLRPPGQLLFTSRVQEAYDRNRKVGVLWARRLNMVWPGHIE